MAAVKRAVIALFGDGGGLPPSETVEAKTRLIFRQAAAGDNLVTRQELYTYVILHSQTGLSGRSIDKLFDRIDVNHDGSLSEDEFVQAILRVYEALKTEAAIDKKALPYNRVVPGSCKLNSLSGTRAFRTQVVRRSSMRRLWLLYKDVDADNDGFITLPEFKRYFNRVRPELHNMTTSIFNSMDKDKSGRLTFKEMLRAFFPEAKAEDIQMLARMARGSQEDENRSRPDEALIDEIRGIFEVYDDDQSGALDEEEFVHAMQLAGFTEAECRLMFKETDADGSGEVSFEEFKGYFINSNIRREKALADAEKDSDAED